MSDFVQFKDEVLTSSEWIISLDEDDLKIFQGNDNYCTIHMDNL